jgi:hypothetical protein
LARNYVSDAKPAGVEDFGTSDNKEVKFAANNNFYYFPNQPFTAPLQPNISLCIIDKGHVSSIRSSAKPDRRVTKHRVLAFFLDIEESLLPFFLNSFIGISAPLAIMISTAFAISIMKREISSATRFWFLSLFFSGLLKKSVTGISRKKPIKS